MIQMNELQKLNPSSIIELFVLDASNSGGGLFYFHAGVNELNEDIVWQGQTYIRFPVEITGFEHNSNGPFPRPKMVVSNYLSGVTTLLLNYDDLIDSKVIRKRTLLKYLDAVNFSQCNESADPSAYFSDDIYYIDRKVSESRAFVEFELVSSLDLSNLVLPKRQIIQNSCCWKYRSAECGYTGTNYYNKSDEQTTDSSQDVCSKRLSGCRVRFGNYAELPYGGFPAAEFSGD